MLSSYLWLQLTIRLTTTSITSAKWETTVIFVITVRLVNYGNGADLNHIFPPLGDQEVFLQPSGSHPFWSSSPNRRSQSQVNDCVCVSEIYSNRPRGWNWWQIRCRNDAVKAVNVISYLNYLISHLNCFVLYIKADEMWYLSSHFCGILLFKLDMSRAESHNYPRYD